MGTIVGVGVGVGYRRVRRPRLPVVDGNILWLRADMGITPNGSDVAGWADQSGNGNDAVQATAADQPAFSAAGGPNSRPAVVFDETNTEELDLTGMTDASNDYTVFAVVDWTSVAGTDMLLITNPVSGLLGVHGAKMSLHDGTAFRDAMVAQAGAQINTWRLDATGTAVEMYRDGVVLGSDTYDGTLTWNTPSICGTGGTYAANLKLSELIVFNRKLTDAEVAQVHAYLAVRYAITFSPLSVADCQGWFRADTGVTGDPVSSWANQGALGNNMAQGTGVKQPAMSTLGGQLSMLYDDTDDSLEYDSAKGDWNFLHDGTGGTLLYVNEATGAGYVVDSARTQDPARIGVVFWQATPTQMVATINNGSGVLLVDTGVQPLAYSTPSIVVMRTETGHAVDDYDFRIAGVQQDNGAFVGVASGADPQGAITFGAQAGGGGTPWGGELPEVMAYDRYLSDTETAALEAYATARYSL